MRAKRPRLLDASAAAALVPDEVVATLSVNGGGMLEADLQLAAVRDTDAVTSTLRELDPGGRTARSAVEVHNQEGQPCLVAEHILKLL